MVAQPCVDSGSCGGEQIRRDVEADGAVDRAGGTRLVATRPERGDRDDERDRGDAERGCGLPADTWPADRGPPAERPPARERAIGHRKRDERGQQQSGVGRPDGTDENRRATATNNRRRDRTDARTEARDVKPDVAQRPVAESTLRGDGERAVAADEAAERGDRQHGEASEADHDAAPGCLPLGRMPEGELRQKPVRDEMREELFEIGATHRCDPGDEEHDRHRDVDKVSQSAQVVRGGERVLRTLFGMEPAVPARHEDVRASGGARRRANRAPNAAVDRSSSRARPGRDHEQAHRERTRFATAGGARLKPRGPRSPMFAGTHRSRRARRRG